MFLGYWLISYLKKIFMKNEKKNVINILTAFSISYKSGIKIFLKWIINKCVKEIY